LKKGIFGEIKIKTDQTEPKIPPFHLLLRTLHIKKLIMQSSLWWDYHVADERKNESS